MCCLKTASVEQICREGITIHSSTAFIEKFFTLPDDVTVYCGHGSETSIGFEKRTNPFCAIN